MRAIGDGTISVILAAYLTAVGLSDLRIDVVVTFTLVGYVSAVPDVGATSHRTRTPRRACSPT